MYKVFMSSDVIFQTQSFFIVVLMFYGISLAKKNRSAHVKAMSTVIIWDILLILQIELTRSAIAKASKAVTNPMMLNIHVAIAVSTVLLYFIMIYTGRKVLKGNSSNIAKHKMLGITTAFMRVATFATSFWAV